MIIVIMGVCGSGKTSVGALLSQSTGIQFIEGDEFHEPASIEKMRQGIALADEDRFTWLDRIVDRLNQVNSTGGSAILACSALKQAYRDHILKAEAKVSFVLLDGPEELIRGRLEDRIGHFASPLLLESQVRTLEVPGDVLVVDIALSLEEIVQEITLHFGLQP